MHEEVAAVKNAIAGGVSRDSGSWTDWLPNCGLYRGDHGSATSLTGTACAAAVRPFATENDTLNGRVDDVWARW